MRKEKVYINNRSAYIWGESSEKVYLYIHGQHGSKEDASFFANIVTEKGWQVISIDLPGHGERTAEIEQFDPWHVVPELQQVIKYVRAKWDTVSLFANSIGAWFSMLTYEDEDFEQCLFLSPVLDMYHLISRMIGWAGVTEEILKEKQVIETEFGQTLYWEYYQYAKKNQIQSWHKGTHILYGTADNLIEYEVVKEFVARFACDLTVMEGGEHWFHTKEQMEVQEKWIRQKVR